MNAIGCMRRLPLDDPQAFVEVTVPTPEPAGRDLLVRVRAVSVNPVDTKTRQAITDAAPKPVILGYDAAGTVERVGGEVSMFKPGDEVFYAGSRARPGTDSEFHLVDERITGPKPRSLSYEEAAALPLTALTAWEAFADRLGLLPHAPAGGAAKSVLIIGGAGGVGSIAVQLAKRVFGLRVIATAGREESAAWCRHMGADLIADRRLPLKAALEQAGAGKVEYILCLNSTEVYLPQMAEVIQPQGSICSIVRAKDNQPLPLNLFFDLSVSFSWEYMFTRPVQQTPDMHAQHAILAEVSRLVDAGVLRTTMRESLGALSTDTLRSAHQRLEAGETIGKLTLSGM